MDSIEEQFRHLLGVPPGHALKLTRLGHFGVIDKRSVPRLFKSLISCSVL
jgi:hypothetical protein